MKKRILLSYRYQEDVVKPLAEFLEISPEELMEIMIKKLDMAGLEALHPRAMQARRECLSKKLEFDLNLCILSDFLLLISMDDKERILDELEKMIDEGKDYESVLREGKRIILEILRRVE